MPSTVISDISYDLPACTLKITFISGSEYAYLNVPPDIFNKLKKSGSKGNYLNRYIKGHFNFKKIK